MLHGVQTMSRVFSEFETRQKLPRAHRHLRRIRFCKQIQKFQKNSFCHIIPVIDFEVTLL